jgi:hypothetical protein
MDDIEREAIRSEGLDPHDPAVVTAIDLVRWDLSMCQTGFATTDTALRSSVMSAEDTGPKSPSSDDIGGLRLRGTGR